MAIYDPVGDKLRRKRYHARHPERVRALALSRGRRYEARHPDRVQTKKRRYRNEHKAEIADYNRQYLEANREHINARKRAYRKTHGPLYAEYEARRKARRLDATIGEVSYPAIIDRDKATCGLCHKKVKDAEMTFDHIVPLSRGGAHAEWNLQVAHCTCNTRKNNLGVIPSQTRLPIAV